MNTKETLSTSEAKRAVEIASSVYAAIAEAGPHGIASTNRLGQRGKRRIKQTVWGNWYGYIGTTKVIAFGELPEQSAEDQAKAWRETGETQLIPASLPIKLHGGVI